MSLIAKTTDREKKRGNAGKRRQGKIMFFMILPFLILNFLFAYFPLHGWVYAFYDYRAPLQLSQCEFVGFKWFTMLFSNPTQMAQLGQVMINTFAMSLLGIATSILPLIFAIFLSEIQSKWFRKSVQTLTTLPNFISWVLVYSVAFSLFSDSGMINNVLQQLGVIAEPIKFLDSDSHTWLSMILWSTWKGLGWNAIMYLAAITGIDPGLYEAAKIDGAGVFRIFAQIVLPTSTPILATIAIFAAVGQWNSFQDTLIYVTDQKLYSLQYLLYTYINQANSLATLIRSSSGGTAVNTAALATQQTPTSIRMTVSVIVVLPILFVYPIFQKYFVKGIMIGSVKG